MFCLYLRCGRWALARLDEVRIERKARCEGTAERTSGEVRKDQHYFERKVPFFPYYDVVIVMVFTFLTMGFIFVLIYQFNLAELVSLFQYFRTLKTFINPM